MASLALSQICGSRGQYQNARRNLDRTPFGCSYGQRNCSHVQWIAWGMQTAGFIAESMQGGGTGLF